MKQIDRKNKKEKGKVQIQKKRGNKAEKKLIGQEAAKQTNKKKGKEEEKTSTSTSSSFELPLSKL